MVQEVRVFSKLVIQKMIILWRKGSGKDFVEAREVCRDNEVLVASGIQEQAP